MATNSEATTGLNNKPTAGVGRRTVGIGVGGFSGCTGVGMRLGSVGAYAAAAGTSGHGTGNDETGSGPNNQQQAAPQYTIPGILHFIQHEWSRFELERSQWEVDRAELQAQIGMLLGERKCFQNLKSDLTRRIKMLEYALRQERAKFYRLKYGTDPPQLDELKPPAADKSLVGEVTHDSEVPYSAVSNTTWRQGRQVLRKYLTEIGYTDYVIDVRSNRVQSILGLEKNSKWEDYVSPNINERRTLAEKPQKSDDTILDTEAEVMTNFEFLGPSILSDNDEFSEDLERFSGDNDGTDVKTVKRTTSGKDMTSEGYSPPNIEQTNNTVNTATSVAARRNIISAVTAADGEEVDVSFGLGELTQLTVNKVNTETERSNDTNSKVGTGSGTDSAGSRKIWNAKYTLRSHFDGVRSLIFHPEEPVLITASEDHTLKLWNLRKTVQVKKSANLDIEPVYTFRAHTGPVLCLGMSPNGGNVYSGDLDGHIECWQMPSLNIELYDSYDPSVHSGRLEGHTDAVWGLKTMHNNIVSCSADKTVRLWSPNTKEPLLRTITAADTEDVPSSVDFVRNEIDHIVVAYNSGHCIIYDTETGKRIIKLEATQDISDNMGKLISKVVSHPTLPITITAHEDRKIRFWDNVSGKLVYSMLAHLDAVTSLAIDPHGLYLLSGSHDCSIRLWNLDNKICLQEITAHRKKFDESVFDVTFHATKPYIASAGADGLAKVFV